MNTTTMRRGTLSLVEMAAELERQDEAKHDFVLDTRRIGFQSTATVESVEPGGQIAVGPNTVLTMDGIEGEFVVNDHAHGQIAGRLGIPKKYYDRMRADSPELLDRNVRHWFGATPERRMVRTLDGGARAFLSDRYRRLDNIDLATIAILPALSEIPGLVVQDCALTETRMYVRALLPSLEAEVKVGDVVQAGVEISNSEVGAGALNVFPRLWRLVCLNGMVMPQAGTRKYHVGRRVEDEGDMSIFSDDTIRADDHAYFMAVGDLVRNALSEVRFAEIVEQLQGLASGPEMKSPVGAVEELGKRLSLTDVEGESILSHLIRGGDLTQWGAVNAVTASAKDADSFEREAELERAGAAVAAIVPREWAALTA